MPIEMSQRVRCVRPVIFLALAMAGLLSADGGTGSALAAAKLDPRALAVARTKGHAAVIVSLAEQADVSEARLITGKVARTRYVFDRLRQVADRTQPPLVAWLQRQGMAVQRFYIVNAVGVTSDAATLTALAARPDVAAVRLSGQVHLIEPIADVDPQAETAAAGALSPLVTEPGLKTIEADKVWKLGYDGQGIVVAITDTGAAYKHPAIKSKYRGAGADDDYNWFDAVGSSPEPVDDDSHGTHVTGIAVGGDAVRQIGVAPGAQWIACRLIKQGSGPDEASLKCLQWVLAPTRRDGSEPRPDLAPDVVNASWGSQPGPECGGLPEIQAAIGNLVAAGILFVAAAGNSGDKCETVCAPGAYPETFTVANYDGPQIAKSSSRGPVKTGNGDLIKPDIAAPGTDINSSVPPTRYEKKSGTSMASPHVTGAVALLLSARPELRGHPDTIRRMLEGAAKPMKADRCGPVDDSAFNNSAGHGLLNIDSAVVTALTATPPPTPTTTSTPVPTEPSPTMGPTDTPTPTEMPPTVTPVPHHTIMVPFVCRRWIGYR